MSSLVAQGNRIPAMSSGAIASVRKLEAALLQAPQAEVKTLHVIHGGMYSRTIKIPRNGLLTGEIGRAHV